MEKAAAAEKCPTPAGWAVLGAVILGAVLTAMDGAAAAQGRDEHMRTKHGMLLAALVLQLLVLVLAIVPTVMT